MMNRNKMNLQRFATNIVTRNDAVKVLKEKGYAVEELKAEKEKVSEDVH